MPKIQAKLTKQDKRFIHRIYKELLQITEKNTIIPLGKKRRTDMNKFFSQAKKYK